ncbi:hypothetical protein ACQP2F_25095 [Actinoplanes sp. CA-030573]|uniref:hypothetical protein n=1 Tax=Actinoplanes sp. CA-030573 TaxID=3239898 RepID=UPI003D8BEF1C
MEHTDSTLVAARAAAVLGVAGSAGHLALAGEHARHAPVVTAGMLLLALVCLRCSVHLWRRPAAPAAWRDLLVLAAVMTGVHLLTGMGVPAGPHSPGGLHLPAGLLLPTGLHLPAGAPAAVLLAVPAAQLALAAVSFLGRAAARARSSRESPQEAANLQFPGPAQKK